MPSSYSTSLRFELQFTGENVNTYGVKLDNTFARMDDAIAGLLPLALTSDHALVSTNDNTAADEARRAIIKPSGAGPFTITVPSVSKTYDVWNTCSGVVTITTGAGTAAAVQPSEVVRVICDGANCARVQPTDFGARQLTSVADPTTPQMAATKAYVDQVAFTANAGILPGQVGANGFALFSNGSNALWKQIASTDLSDFNANIKGVQVALAVAL